MRQIFESVQDLAWETIVRHIRARNMSIDARGSGEGDKQTSADQQEYTVILNDAMTGELIEIWVMAAAADLAPSQAIKDYLDEEIDPARHDEYLRKGYVSAMFCYAGHLEDLGVPELVA